MPENAADDNSPVKTIRLHPGRDRSLRRGHPWVYAGAVARGGADAGETVRVESADGEFLAWGAYSGASQIRIRAWSFDADERIDGAFFARRVATAVALRSRLGIASSAWRVVHGEADGLPGLVVDRYGDDTLVAQFGSTGVERHKSRLADALLAATGATRLYERSDAAVRALEGLPPQTGWLRGDGQTTIDIVEHGWRFQVDVAGGHKTGTYLDQRDNRAHFARWLRTLQSRRVLNAYGYTGGFTIAALAAGADHVTTVDSSAPALVRVTAHVAANGFDAARSEVVDADVNAFLRAALRDGLRYDAIVVDPPKLAPTAAHAERAARAYKDVNRLALMLLAPGGLLFTFSCSGGVDAGLFHKIVAGAAIDAGIDAAIVQRLEAASDHPTTLRFPEGEYLKGLALVKAAAAAP